MNYFIDKGKNLIHNFDVKVFIKIMKRVILLKLNKNFLITRSAHFEILKCALVKANMNNSKMNIYKKFLLEVCEKFNDAEAFFRERIEELCNEKKYKQKR